MAIPLLNNVPTTQNHRVSGYEVPDEDTPLVYRLTDVSSESEVNDLIWAAYRQIFGEHLILESNRQVALESQLRNRSISVREFIRGLGKSDVYRELVSDTNSNYRLVDVTFKRFLGRATYGQDERISWSIVIATQGLHGFIDAVVDSDEYRQNFGNNILPYQRRRFDGRPFNLVTPRYSDYWRNKELQNAGRSYYQARQYRSGDLDRAVVRQAIPANFLAMASRVLPQERNYQRTIASVTSQIKTLSIPDTSHTNQQGQRRIQPTRTSLPYDYIPGVEKV
ncbi:MAG: phycobilisome rod-core linker polypeptide [Thainema sp.]